MLIRSLVLMIVSLFSVQTISAPLPPANFRFGLAWPDATNTGVPAGTTLTTYSGPCVIFDNNVIIDSKNIVPTCPNELDIRGTGTVITKSNLPRIDLTNGTGPRSVSITDSRIDAGQDNRAAVWGSNITLLRAHVTGGQHNVQCDYDCDIRDSYLHGQWNPPGLDFHNNAFITNGGARLVVIHNTLHCDTENNGTGGGCTADISLFGDFAQVDDVLVQNNLMKWTPSGGYCAYAGYEPQKAFPNSTNIRYIDNTFERGPTNKCGGTAPATSYNPAATGNQWTGNKYTDGVAIPAP